jgi:hypothetical protein
MDLHPWGLWRPDGTPEGGTEDIIAALESVLKRDPNHMGAIHYYIGLAETLRAQNRAYDAQFVDKQFQSNWKGPELKLKVADLT